jgi:hypothetical protein
VVQGLSSVGTHERFHLADRVARSSSTDVAIVGRWAAATAIDWVVAALLGSREGDVAHGVGLSRFFDPGRPLGERIPL